MATSKSFPDMSGLVVAKGQAAPAAALAPSVPKSAPVAATTAPKAPAPQQATQAAKPVDPAGAGFHKAMTLKLDKARYTQIKQLGLDEDTTSQDLLVEAVDMLLAQRAAIAATE